MLLHLAIAAVMSVNLAGISANKPVFPAAVSTHLQFSAPHRSAPVVASRPEMPEVTLAPRLPSTTPGANLGVFKSVAISAARLPSAAKWQDARQTDYTALFAEDCSASGLDGCDSRFATQIRGLHARTDGLEQSAMLDMVNRTVNSALRYKSDDAIWGTADHWATPVEMAQMGAGDCEDFAIAKYWALRSLGLDDSQLQLVLLQDTRRQLFHAVLVVHTGAGAYVLDNVTNNLRIDTAYAQYQPILSFSGDKSYLHGFAAGTTAMAAMPKDLSLIAPGTGL